jgi:DNA-binding transcriptional LysR family regulator
MNETIELDDMRLFARLFHRPAGVSGDGPTMSAAARALGVPKQTVSRRVARLERALGVELVRVTGKVMRPTAAGIAYAARCAEIARLAEDANRDVIDAARTVRGVLRLTADPVFGDAFLGALLVDYASRFADVKLDVVLTRARVDLAREGFDVAFRVGAPIDPELHGVRLGDARVRFCASPVWAQGRRVPLFPAELATLDCLLATSDSADVRWPVPFEGGPRTIAVRPRHRFSSLPLALDAARGGLGVGLFPDFVCGPDLRRGALVDVLGQAVDVGAVWLLHAPRRSLPTRVSAFVTLAKKHFASAPWVVP